MGDECMCWLTFGQREGRQLLRAACSMQPILSLSNRSSRPHPARNQEPQQVRPALPPLLPCR